MASNKTTLYDRVGGDEGIARLVNSFYARVLDDNELAEFFSNTPIDQLKKMQKEFFTLALGGSVEYSGLSLSHAHQGRGIRTVHFKSFVNHLLETLSEFNLTEEESYQIITDINRYVEDIADDSAAPIA